MKKIYSLLIVIIFLFTLSSCGGSEVEPNEGKVIFEFPKEYLQYLPYVEGEVPNFVLEFEGNINTVISASLSNRKFFSKNDDFVFSEIVSKLLSEYADTVTVKDRTTVRLISEEEQFETRMNKLVEDKNGELKQESQIMKVEDEKIFNEIAFLNLKNGLTLSIEYRRFVSKFDGELKTYYSWRYSTPLNMVLHYPVMLHLNKAGEKEFLIVPLPSTVEYHLSVSSQLPLEKLLEDKYFEPNFRRFFYPDWSDDPTYNEEFDLVANINKVKDYYKGATFNGKEENDIFSFTYLGYSFKVTFENEFFQIDIIED